MKKGESQGWRLWVGGNILCGPLCRGGPGGQQRSPVPPFWSCPGGFCDCPLTCCASPRLLLGTKNSTFPDFTDFTTTSSRKWSILQEPNLPPLTLACPQRFSHTLWPSMVPWVPCWQNAHLPVSTPRTGGTPNKLPSCSSGGISTHKSFTELSAEMFLLSCCGLPRIQAAYPPISLFLVLPAKEGKEGRQEPQTRG